MGREALKPKLLACFQHLGPQGRTARKCNPPTNKAIRKGEKDSLKTWTIAIRATVLSKGHDLILPTASSWRAERTSKAVVGTQLEGT
jgi:hypothetical protein